MDEEGTKGSITDLVVSNKKQIEIIDPETTKTEQLQLELEEVKVGLQNIAAVGEKALGELSELARSSQHPKAYEALSNTIRALNETHKELNNVLANKKILIDSEKTGNQSAAETNVTNNTLIMSSSELLKLIKQKASEEDGE